MNYNIKYPKNNGGMNDRIKRLRQQNFDTPTTLSIERALIETAFYKEHYGTMPIAVLRAKNFYEICKKKTIYIGEDELIVGERGPLPKAVPTFPELTCHSVEDLHTLNERELQRYTISQEDIDTYEREVIPYWQGKTQRERIFNHVSCRRVHGVHGTACRWSYSDGRKDVSRGFAGRESAYREAYQRTGLHLRP